MAHSTKIGAAPPSRNAIHQLYYTIHSALHFEKGYNFPLFIICTGALLGFSLSRLMYLDIDGTFITSTNPSDAIEYRKDSGKQTVRVGIIMHLATILPAGILVVFQFVPIIRHKLLLFHRVNGYVIITLFYVSMAGAFMLFPQLVNYRSEVQLGLGVLGVGCTISITLAYVNVKRLQIEQHRAWMLRTWVWAGSIVSLRLIAMAARHVINRYLPDRYYATFTCGQIFDMYALHGLPDNSNPTPLVYPACAPSGFESFDRSLRAIVKATTNSYTIGDQTFPAGPETFAAISDVTFGMSTWLALVLHVVLGELYLRLTPKETNRLRHVSYKKQLAAGMRKPGSAGFVVQRWGDAEAWEPPQEVPRHDDEYKGDHATPFLSHEQNEARP